MERAINKLIDNYKGTPHTELEIRLKKSDGISREMFEAVYNGLLKKTTPQIEYTISFISTNVFSNVRYVKNEKNTRSANQIKLLEYDPSDFPPAPNKQSKLKGIVMYEKQNIESVRVSGYFDYTVNISKEIPIEKNFSTQPNALVRAKIRASFISEDGNWSYDITAVNESRTMTREIQNNIAPNFFAKELTPETFLTDMNYDYVTRFEIEIEHIGEDKTSVVADDISIVNSLFIMINPSFKEKEKYQEEVYEIAKHIIADKRFQQLFKNKFSLKKLSNQPIGLTRNNYGQLYPPNGYLATEKASGVRCMISINGNRMRLLADKMYEYFISDERGVMFIPGKITIADAELVYIGIRGGFTDIVGGDVNSDNPEHEFALLVFDVMVFKDDNIAEFGYKQRITYLDEAVSHISKFMPGGADANPKKLVPGTVRAKKILELQEGNYERTFRQVYGKYPYDIDGIIISQPDKSYRESQVYKWKPVEENTIDFLAIQAPKHLLGVHPFIAKKDHTIYMLFVGISYKSFRANGMQLSQDYTSIFPTMTFRRKGPNTVLANQEYFPIQFTPSIDPHAFIYYHSDKSDIEINKKIIELSRGLNADGSVNTAIGSWNLERIRDDRKMEENYFGNDFNVAESIYQNFIDPFPFEELWSLKSGYFNSQSPAETKMLWGAKNNLQRYVITNIINLNMKNANLVIDLAAGRGADLGRLFASGVRSAMCVDIDLSAISELLQRKNVISRDGKLIARRNQSIGKRDVGMSVSAAIIDLTSPSPGVISIMENHGHKRGSADAVMMNFAIHYMCDTPDNLSNIMNIVGGMLKVGGVFFVSAMDGKKIHELFTDEKIGENKSYISNHGDVVKYQLKRLYKSKALSNFGQKIAVKLPFATELYEEYLCNFDFLIARAKKVGLTVRQDEYFSESINDFSRVSTMTNSDITEDDKKYIGLHRYIVFHKTRNVIQK